MATYFIGGGVESYVTSPAGAGDSEGAVSFEGSQQPFFADCIPRDPASGDRVALNSFWFHVEVDNTGAGGRNGVIMFNEADAEVVQINGEGQDKVRLNIKRNGAWVPIGDIVATGAPYRYDIRVVAHPSAGRLSFCVNGVTVVEQAGLDTSQLAGINRIRLQSAIDGNASRYTRYSGAIIATYNTIGHTVRLRVPNADASNAGWTGSYRDVDEGTNKDADAINTSTTGATILFNANALSPTPTGNVVKAVSVAARIRNDGGAVPRNAKATLSIGGSVYSAPFNFNVGPGYAGAVTVFDRDPSTGLAWDGVGNINVPFGLTATE
ncbi:hypothetical protein HMP09_1239 [Sphingomonas sp. HMP9]|uniref:hypothetical protein n=1 Tax=Sphingomonas sp. HMP9 TaxID=1517554 RepID=UPI001596CA01|nr:hypothetical protein [Sphingomonas sp. HMP9]BCA62005.1 hypothetical protein HMP09_1239 [Sphingomonas sp. HMP9]